MIAERKRGIKMYDFTFSQIVCADQIEHCVQCAPLLKFAHHEQSGSKVLQTCPTSFSSNTRLVDLRHGFSISDE